MDQWGTIPVTQLVDAITAPYQNKDSCGRQKSGKNLERRGNFLLLSRCLSPLAPPYDIFDYKSDEDNDEEDLERQAGNGDVDGGFAAARSSRG